MSFSTGGGGGSASVSTSTDVALNNPTTDQVLTFNQSLSKWQNKAPSIVSVGSKSGTAYTLTLDDAGTVVETTGDAAVSITVPANAAVAFPVGMTIALRQYGLGQLTVVPGSGVVIRSRGNAYKSGGQYAEAVLSKRASDEWILSGDLVA